MHSALCDRCRAEIDWVDIPDAAGILHLSENRVRQLREDGRFPNAYMHYPRKGRPFWKLPLADVAAFMEATR